MNILSVPGNTTRLGQRSRVLERSVAGNCRHQGGTAGVIFFVTFYFGLLPQRGGGGKQEGWLNQERGIFEVVVLATQEGGAPSSHFLLHPHSFCLLPLFLIHRRAGAFGIAKDDFWQGSLWEERYRRRGRFSKSISQSLSLSFSFLS